MKKGLLFPIIMLLSIIIFAQQEVSNTTISQKLIITTKMNNDKTNSSTVYKLPLKDIELPQAYKIILSTLFKDNFITNLKNTTEMSILQKSVARKGAY